jgi:hypothetical protein
MDDNKKIKKELELFEDQESMELLRKSKERQGKQLRIDVETGDLHEIDELKEMLNKTAEDPEEKYSTYYTGIRNILMKYLPSGKESQEIRELIYDEKNVFLNRGKKKSDNNGIRKSDGRMTYQEYMHEMLDLITTWVSQSQIPFDLYHMIYELNERHNYGHENYDKTTIKYKLAVQMQREK